jgi:ABC-type polysaccharide/polyol phosphate transport system ATPase subunit
MQTGGRGSTRFSRYPLGMPVSADDSRCLPAVVVRSVSKTFRVPEERTHTLKERALHPRRRTGHHTFPALHDISFDVRRGEFFGIAGRNGSGRARC